MQTQQWVGWLQCGLLPFKIVSDPDYDFRLGLHVFPSEKYRMVRERLLSERFAVTDDFFQPGLALDEDLQLAHTQDWSGVSAPAC